ncbi:hypothetical protein EV368DRAFT_46615 [Lentinula lateritia]|uniref:Uncharacterized protein n=1 Tax=Lentinula aff. lateritia TaxID=2804960 RepID=A0ACC1TSM4_9AGAR|nr:hypothetical protein F5876DRAFT_47706 [Lentinula aff. lateritia]KAJ3849783.1 hypothetical protein EV368DRAFT_46615 [Lentinula lateritia]
MAETTFSKGSLSTSNRRPSRKSAGQSSSSAKKGLKRASDVHNTKAAATGSNDEEERHLNASSDSEKQPAKKKILKKRNARKRAKDYDSDALDDDSEFDEPDEEEEEEPRKPKRKRANTGKQNRTSSPRKRRHKANQDDEEDDFDLKEGQEVVGEVVQAPKTGRVPPGQISKNTFDFLHKLADPECNDREWCALRYSLALQIPVYRLAEKEFKDFVDAFTEVLTEVDPHIPPLPPKDVIHRIYRDVRFSNDKTPYKKNLSSSFSRSGRKGIFACFSPGDQTLLAAGTWCPGKNELATIRSNIARSSDRLRQVISDPEFVKLFGEPKPMKDGSRRNIFGAEDELKVAPKGFAKDHKDIDVLKCRTFAVVHRFKDSEVLAPDFKTKLGEVAAVVRPFVHCLNDLMTLQDNDGGDDDDDDDDEET